MDEKRVLLRHFLAALAYRTQKALRDAPPEFADFRAAPQVRTPHELVHHMDSVLGYSRTLFLGGTYRPPALPNFHAAIEHFHEVLTDVARHIELGTELHGITPEVPPARPLLRRNDARRPTRPAASSLRKPRTARELHLCRHHPRQSRPKSSTTPQPRQSLARKTIVVASSSAAGKSQTLV